MVRKHRETKLERLNKSVHEIMHEIAKDKERYPEYEAIKSKLTYVSDQIIEQITEGLKKEQLK